MVHPITACFLAVCLIVQRITDNNRINVFFMLNIAATVIVFVVGNSFLPPRAIRRFHSKGY